jgi:hypothetical protein
MANYRRHVRRGPAGLFAIDIARVASDKASELPLDIHRTDFQMCVWDALQKMPAGTTELGPLHTQLTIFPEDSAKLSDEAKKDGLVLDGPLATVRVTDSTRLNCYKRYSWQKRYAHP